MISKSSTKKKNQKENLRGKTHLFFKISRETKSPRETRKLAEVLAGKILKKKKRKKPFFLGLVGDLGGGKTTFLQGFARGLGIRGKITSPTFIIVRRHKIQNKKQKIQNFFHIDCYRVRNSGELLNLGFGKIISDPKNIVAVEWADRISKIVPSGALVLKFEFVDKNKRKISKIITKS